MTNMSPSISIEGKRNDFVRVVAPAVRRYALQHGLSVSSLGGLGLAPMHRYSRNGPDEKLRGKTCVILGRKPHNPSHSNKVSVLGRPVVARGGGAIDEYDVAHTIFECLFQQLMIFVTGEQFLAAVLMWSHLVIRSQNTLVVCWELFGFGCNKWTMLMDVRLTLRPTGLHRSFFEVSVIRHVSVDDASTDTSVTRFVSDVRPILKRAEAVLLTRSRITSHIDMYPIVLIDIDGKPCFIPSKTYANSFK